MADLRVLTWNLFHGRDHPPDPALFTRRSRLFRVTERNPTHAQVNRPLLGEFADVIAGAEWSVCFLQETPRSWVGPLAERSGAEAHAVLTSRTQLARLRRRLAGWNPDLIASGEGGSNVILVRAPWRIAERGTVLLNPFPRRGLRERRRMTLATLVKGEARGEAQGKAQGKAAGQAAGEAELCVANLHATAGDQAQAEEDLRRGAMLALDFARGRPLVLGGDLNLRPRTSSIFSEIEDRLELAAPTAPGAIDHLLSRGLEVVAPPHPWPPERREVPFEEAGAAPLRLRLSDHAPVEAAFRLLM
jgi:endonuclease/exonuclease/phosphatase family metal-dependent hydrolase